MPVHEAEENAPSNIYDQVAKESKDSTASTHDTHAVEGVTSVKATAQDHAANPGPVQAGDIGKPESKEDLKARAAELNK